jgi:Cu(I)/Ag(I) efflux system membrane protein CusA/SilA
VIERLIEASARNKFVVFIFAIFGVAAGVYGLLKVPLDAIPDLSDVQVIVYTDWEGRSPDLVEDQITYPISTVFIAAPKVKFVRGESMFGKSFVYVIFEDGTDIYWARSRVIEYLNSVRGSLPEGVNPVIGPTPRASAGCMNTHSLTTAENMILPSCAQFRIGICATRLPP